MNQQVKVNVCPAAGREYDVSPAPHQEG